MVRVKGYTLAVPARRVTKKAAADPLGSVFDALPIGLYVVDRELEIVAWNSLRERGPLGRPRRLAVGRPLRAVLGKQGFAATEPVLRRVLRSGKPHEEIVETSGSLYHVRRLPVVRGKETSHVLSWFEDITARRQREMQLIAADRLAFLGQLVSGVAHEISNPLAGIAGCAEALASLASRGGRAERREARQFRDLIRTEVARCERIVQFLLDSSREGGGERADVGETLAVALRLLERHPALARLRVRNSLKRDLPAVQIDSGSLKQVVMALVLNASAAMSAGGTLGVAATRRGRMLHLDVADTGAPIPEGLRDHVFEPFGHSDAQRGANLGLAVARGLLRSRGGDLMYRPRKDGNTFRVVLRVATGTR
jgi:signal transduction histidine kinase